MNGKFHTTIGVGASLLICNATNIKVTGLASNLLPTIHIPNLFLSGNSCIDIITISYIASTIPDADLKLPFMKHRTWTHGLLIFFISTLFIKGFGNNLYIIWAISYLSHIVADSFTSMGVPFFYPFIKKRYGLKFL